MPTNPGYLRIPDESRLSTNPGCQRIPDLVLTGHPQDNFDRMTIPSMHSATSPRKQEAILKRGMVFIRFPQSLGGKLKTLFFGILLFPPRLILFLLSGLVGFSLAYVFLTTGLMSVAVYVLSIQARVWLFCFGVWNIREVGTPYDSKKETVVIVSNHIGIHEILWFFSLYTPGFVAKSGVSKVPIIGPICKALGSVFVYRKADRKIKKIKKNSENDRKKPPLVDEKNENKKSATEAMISMLSQKGKKLCIFPEGTTTNGLQMLKFRSGAFIPLSPVLPHYVSFQGFNRGVDFDPHYSAVPITRWLLGVMSQGYISFTVHYLPIQRPKEGERNTLMVRGIINCVIQEASGLKKNPGQNTIINPEGRNERMSH
ncbi:hypothetical protein AAMO2058_000995200 [Amorphochlora amoebiformis]